MCSKEPNWTSDEEPNWTSDKESIAEVSPDFTRKARQPPRLPLGLWWKVYPTGVSSPMMSRSPSSGDSQVSVSTVKSMPLSLCSPQSCQPCSSTERQFRRPNFTLFDVSVLRTVRLALSFATDTKFFPLTPVPWMAGCRRRALPAQQPLVVLLSSRSLIRLHTEGCNRIHYNGTHQQSLSTARVSQWKPWLNGHRFVKIQSCRFIKK